MIYIYIEILEIYMLHAVFVEIRPPVTEKIFEVVLPYMGIAVILGMLPRLFL